eukprot:TRINITY_DN10678_c0_g1_i1.p1 TRINITY_DN10678_c0_g1~~TRINITY_DN10678_c0_g1_i1.p1  ORF type:complete len:576 (+),score=185.56 TRINITY_DN10678_c0_g1_i1:98-1729(+)
MEQVAPLVADGTISAEELLHIAQRHSQGDRALIDQLISLAPVRAVSPEGYTAAVRAVMAKAMGSAPTAPPSARVHPSPSAPTKAPAKTAPGTGGGGSMTSECSSEPDNDSTPPSGPPRHHVDPTAPVSTAPVGPVEAIAICVDVSGSMQSRFGSGRNRLEAVKQSFYRFRDQTQDYCRTKECDHHLALLSYNDSVTVHTPATGDFDQFENAVDKMRHGGGTAIYDAIASGAQLLLPRWKQNKCMDLRVLVLSDGESNRGSVTPQDALDALGMIGAVCDCIIVGDSPDADLLRIVTASNGCAFSVTSMKAATELFEAEAVISLAARRNGAARPNQPEGTRRLIKGTAPAKLISGYYSTAGPDEPCQSVPLAEHLKTAQGGSVRAARLKSELGKLHDRIAGSAADLSKFYPRAEVLTREGSVTGLRVWLRGADGTPYAGGTWQLVITFPDSFPLSPPGAELKTPIYHYAVSQCGTFSSLPILDKWSPGCELVKLLQELRELLMDSDSKDRECKLAVRSWLAEKKRSKPAEYRKEAAEHTKEHAMK